MCGIAGIIKFPSHDAPPAPWHTPRPDDAALHSMADALAHRGPDGAGFFTDHRPATTAALVHRRLAIIDLPCGHQPMANEDGRVHVVFNGEIYNHADLRRALQSAGHRFATDHSDTEVLVHGWEEWGPALPEKLRGMFAFAVWDTRPNPATGRPLDTLFLARDRMGQKPLFYATLEDGIVFGSTIGSVLAWPEVPRRVPSEQLGLYLLLGYLPAPTTIWRDISQLLPGTWLRLRGEVVDGGRFWQPASAAPLPPAGRAAPGTRLRTTLAAAVRSQLIADVPIACFLSGGIDSSITAALMQREVLAAGGSPIHTVSVGFAEAAFDETHYAAAVANTIGSRHTRLEVNPAADVLPTLDLLMSRSLGQPYADSSILPTYHLSRAVRQMAPVALSGDGADELFGGYDRYRAMTLLHRWGGLARLLPRSAPVGATAKRERFRRLAAAARGRGLADRYTRLMEIFPLPLAEELLGQPVDDWLPCPPEYPIPADRSPARYAMLRDQQDYLPNDVLWKVDSAAMAVALEVRSPFMDHDVVAYANALDDDWLLHHGAAGGKYILRHEFAAELPPAVRGRGKKGFAVPIGAWFNGLLRPALHDLLNAKDALTTQHLRPQVARRLLDEHRAGARDHTHRLFALLMMELWWRHFRPSLED
jgi:asparagine synthase (glutamine-hydrolysing)